MGCLPLTQSPTTQAPNSSESEDSLESTKAFPYPDDQSPVNVSMGMPSSCALEAAKVFEAQSRKCNMLKVPVQAFCMLCPPKFG